MIYIEPLWVGSRLAVRWNPALAQALTFRDEKNEMVQMFEQVGDTMLVPRNVFTGKVPEDRRTVQPVGAINCTKPAKNEDQASIIAQSISLLQQDHNHIIEAPTGWGKTYVGAVVAVAMQQATLILVDKEDLFDQWYSTLVNLIGVPPNEIGIIKQNRCDTIGKRFVIGSLQSVVLPNRYPPETYRYFGMVIFDEVHRLGSEDFSKACAIFAARYRLGLSATPKRWDGRQLIFQSHIGPVLLKGSVIPMFPRIVIKETGWQVPNKWQKDDETGEWTYHPMHVTPGRMMGLYKVMAADVGRNTMIVDFTLAALKKGRTVVLMSDLKEHLHELFRRLVAAGVSGDRIGYYVGGLKGKAARQHSAHRDVVLATYKFAQYGTDFPHWDTAVFCTPRADIKQIVGRIIRDEHEKMQPTALDLVDAHPTLRGFFRARVKQYQSINANYFQVK